MKPLPAFQAHYHLLTACLSLNGILHMQYTAVSSIFAGLVNYGSTDSRSWECLHFAVVDAMLGGGAACWVDYKCNALTQ